MTRLRVLFVNICEKAEKSKVLNGMQEEKL